MVYESPYTSNYHLGECRDIGNWGDFRAKSPDPCGTGLSDQNTNFTPAWVLRGGFDCAVIQPESRIRFRHVREREDQMVHDVEAFEPEPEIHLLLQVENAPAWTRSTD